MRLTLVPCLAAAACDPGWTLTLDPGRFPNQRPVATDDEVTLVTRAGDEVRLDPLGTGADRRWLREDQAPLTGARLGLLVQARGADPTRYDPSALRAWGESAPVPALDGDVTVALTLGAFGAPGSLPAPAVPLAGATAAMTADGRSWWFADGRVHRLDDPDAGGRALVDVGPLDATGATAVAAGDVVWLIGGPGARTFDGVTPTDLGPLTHARTRPVVIPQGDGWLVIGGDDGATWERLGLDGSSDGGALGVGPRDFAAAPLGEGALVCGGRDVEPVTTCVRIDGDGLVDAPPLPIALHGHAMAALADGRVLALGGHPDACATTPCWASDRVFVLADGAWTEAAPLAQPRAGAVVVPTRDGRAVILGGAAATDPILDPAACAEVFDGAAPVAVGPCHAAIAGVHPIVAFDPDQGAVVSSGASDEDPGGAALAFVSTGPPAAVVNGGP